MTTLRRRTLLFGLAAAPILTVLPAMAGPGVDWAARLQRDLADAVRPFSDTELRLTGFGLEASDPVQMAALVEMHWPHGLRRRQRVVSAATEDAAYDALYSSLLQEFRSVNRACFV